MVLLGDTPTPSPFAASDPHDGGETITADPDDPVSTLREWFGITGASV